MKGAMPDGVWPTMVTPFTEAGQIDFEGLGELIDWYLRRRVAGLFAVCQSSEMFHLSLGEKRQLARFVREKVNGRVPVVASGNTASSFAEQLAEIEAMAETGADAVVLVTNRFARRDEDDDAWQARVEAILSRFPGLAFGLYECPFPYKRLLSGRLMQWCVATGRFLFVKDTTCDPELMREKIRIAGTSGMKIYNANAPTLLASLRIGAAGYSGVMANFHPELYAWLVRNWRASPEKAARLQDFLGVASLIETPLYPVNAKYALALAGLRIGLTCRARNAADFQPSNRLEVEQLHRLERAYAEDYSLGGGALV